MERRFVTTEMAPVELEERQGDTTKFVGYAARFYDGTPGTQYKLFEYEDRDGKRKTIVERIEGRAFDRMMNDGDDVRLLFNHDTNLILGRRSAGTLTLSVFPKKGLRYIGVAGDTSIARDVQQHIRRGDVTGSSFSFTLTRDDEDWSTEGDELEVRTIKNFSRVMDVGPCCFPAYEATSAGMRSTEDISDTMYMDKGSAVQFVRGTIHYLCEKRHASFAVDTFRERLTEMHKRRQEIEKQIAAVQARAVRVRAESIV